MFLRKVALARKTLKISKKRKQKKSSTPPGDSSVCPAIVEPLYYEEPPESSVASSDVEYIEDDEDYAESVDGARVTASLAEDRIHEKDDDLLALSVSVPLNAAHSDDDSCLSQEGIVKLPANLDLAEKSRPVSTKVLDRDVGPSLTESTSSEGHLTEVTENTCAETCSTSMGSDKHESQKRKRLDAWRQCKEEEIDRLGETSPKTAANLLEVGTMYLQCEDFDRAREYFVRAVNVSQSIFEMPDLRIARALELYAIVESANTTSTKKDSAQLGEALSCLDTAFGIRYELQGPEHIDTVEALGRIARVQLKQRKYVKAKDSYYEVLKLREAIFGSDHPCCAITARALAIAHTRLFQADEAKFYFQAALAIYERNGLGGKAFADVIRKDLQDLKRLKLRCEV